MKIIFKTIILIFLLISISFAQVPDTIIIKTKRIKGFGPFPVGLSFAKTMDSNNTWKNTLPEIKGIPNNLEHIMIAIEQTDFMQHTYQLYHSGKISEERFSELKKSWNWNPLEKEYSKDFIKVDLAIVAGYDKNGLLKIKVDKNNNYDLSDDKYFTLPDKLPGQNFWGRYNDNLPFEITYEYYNGKNIIQNKAWLYIDYSPLQYNSKEKEPNPIVLSYAFAEYHLGEFTVNGIKYFAAIKSDRVTFRDNYKIKVWNENSEKGDSKFNEGISRNGFVKIENYYYRFDRASIDGKRIILIKDQSVKEKGGNQVGLKAINFVSKSISGNKIELSKLKGNFVFLDFWGTWCSPCRAEIPKLKSIYNQYKDKNLVMIGIANDNIENLNKYITENGIQWEQIIQSEDKQIITDYGVNSYPTTFLIDEKGVIIAKGIRAEELSNKLEKLFNK